jgi:type I restriction enzyme S subunit
MKYRLGDICTITKGAIGIMKAIPGPYTMIALGETDKTHNEYQFDAKAVIIPLVSSTGHGHASMKRVKYFEGKFALGNILCAVIPKDNNFVLAKYLHIYLHWNREELLVSQMKGMANVSLPMNRIADVIVTVPSIEKQKEIIELEKKLVERELEADKLFAFQLTHLENLNQAILQEAVQGKLVKQDPKDEPANELLKRIKAEKAKSGKKEKPLPPIKPEEVPFEIPKNWVWCRLGEITNIQRGSSPRPKGDPRYFSKSKTTLNWITISDISNFCENNILLQTREFLTEEGSKQSRYVDENEFIIAVSGSTTGKCCITGIKGFIYDGLAVAKIIDNSFNSRYLLNYMMCLYTTINNSKTGASFPNINTDYLNNLIFPLPPLAEQLRINKEIEKQLAKTKQLKEHIIANQQATEQLLKALLHQAFEVNNKIEV